MGILLLNKRCHFYWIQPFVVLHRPYSDKVFHRNGQQSLPQLYAYSGYAFSLARWDLAIDVRNGWELRTHRRQSTGHHNLPTKSHLFCLVRMPVVLRLQIDWLLRSFHIMHTNRLAQADATNCNSQSEFTNPSPQPVRQLDIPVDWSGGEIICL